MQASECTRQIYEVFLHIFLLTDIWLLTNSCTNRLEKQTISVANLLYECSKEESILIEAYKSATISWIQAKPRASSRKSHVSFAHAQQRFDTIRAEPFLVQFSLLAKKKGLCSQGAESPADIVPLIWPELK